MKCSNIDLSKFFLKTRNFGQKFWLQISIKYDIVRSSRWMYKTSSFFLFKILILKFISFKWKKNEFQANKRIRGDYFSDWTRMLNNVIILMKPVIKNFFLIKLKLHSILSFYWYMQSMDAQPLIGNEVTNSYNQYRHINGVYHLM